MNLISYNLTDDEQQLLSAALIFCEKEHPNYKKEFRRLWTKLFLMKQERLSFAMGVKQADKA